MGKPAPETSLDLNEATDDGVLGNAVASAGPYAYNLCLAPDRLSHQHLITQFFTIQMPFLTPNQQCQTTEGNILLLILYFTVDANDAMQCTSSEAYEEAQKHGVAA